MNETNTLLLFEKYPKIFPVEDRADLRVSLMAFGFECGDGWFQIVDNLCERIQNYVDLHKCEQVVAKQVKEKYGELRFYVDSAPYEVYTMIDEATRLSHLICESCGTNEKVFQTTGWVFTTCYACHKSRLQGSHRPEEEVEKMMAPFKEYK